MLKMLAAFLILTTFCLRAADAPNVVFILADDLGIGDLACYNPDSRIRTPVMNQLAADGMRFTDMHTPSSVCTPTRYAMLTGRYCWRSSLKKGVLWGFSPALLEPGRETIASMLAKRGYHTACVGKWHLGLGTDAKADYSKPFNAGPHTAGFAYSYCIPASLDMEPYCWVVNGAVEKEPTETVAASKHQREGGAGFWRGGPIAPGFKHEDVLPRIVEKSCAYVAERSKEKKPFFLYIPLTSPHTPWLPTGEFAGKSAVGAYGDFTEQTDAALGTILKALDDGGVRENTLVFLTSDNGSHWPQGDIAKWNHRANHVYRGQKSDIHEAGHRVPFLVRWPGRVAPGSVGTETACLTDVFRTLARLTGDVPENAAEDSFDLLPVLLGRGAEFQRAPVVHHSGDGMFALRNGDWKFIDGLGSGGFTAPKFVQPKPGEPTGQLYNLKDDAGETKNLIAGNPAKAAELKALLERLKAAGRSHP